MQIKYINHASILWSSDDGLTNILSDPWYLGSAFLDGWSLMWDTDLENVEFPEGTHIWISHEHPDHFSTPTLRYLHEKIKSCTFLYQDTHDSRVVDWLTRHDYAVKTLSSGKKIGLGNDVHVMCRSIGTGDSYLLIEDHSGTFINTNDSIILPGDLRRLRRDCHKFRDVSVLTSQFGLAGKVGNSEDTESREIASAEVLSVIKRQLQVTKAKYFMPSASLKLFSAADNNYMNFGQTRLEDVLDGVTDTGAIPLFLQPGDHWNTGDETPDPRPLIAKYDSIIHKQMSQIFEMKHDTKETEYDLESALTEWWNRMRTFHQPIALKLLQFSPLGYRLARLDFFLSDLNVTISFQPRKRKKQNKNSIVKVNSNVLKRALTDDFGIMSLLISARVECTAKDQLILRIMGLLGSMKAANQRLSIYRLTALASRSISFLLHQ